MSNQIVTNSHQVVIDGNEIMKQKDGIVVMMEVQFIGCLFQLIMIVRCTCIATYCIKCIVTLDALAASINTDGAQSKLRLM